ncbi:hypothetical protein [Agromyces mangrovi Wang et al. 2018]|uniref:hypothetical protein n=1 Tax=Agromyces mangrovi TaxID=1858653 RepID=UPI0025722A7F|nr:hypothetical protein [Agromyces mangrovi]BDZ66432.1 hypothetical protein GCM10025877_33700 [Agromyces mangrovi]
MTSWQDPPLTRREARERERLLAQQAASSTPDAPAAAPEQAAPDPVPPQAAAPAPPVQPAPQPSFPQPVQATPAAPAWSSQATPPPAPPVRPAAESTPQPPVPAARESAPERTLTRRELRALLESQGESTQDELDAPSLPPAPPARQAPAAERSATPVAMTSHHAANQAPAPSFEPVSVDTPTPAGTSTPTGHWSLQMAEDEPEAPTPFDQLLARGGSGRGGSTTTNALILPSLPNPGAMTHPATGEVMVTGSIDLPRSYGSTGAHPSHIDSPDLDSMFDQMEDTGGGVAPISAARAVSTQTSQRGVITPPKKEGVNVPLVLAVTAGVLALGVVGTLVAGYVLNLF